MSEPRFPHYIEDWILWLGRSKDKFGNDIDFPYYKGWPIKLANYDITFITRSCDAIRKNIGFTQRQVEMATKIVTKYQRQIIKTLGQDPSYLNVDCPTRLPLRDVDRSFSVTEAGDYYHVKFPYDPQLVDRMHKFAVMASGDFKWDKENRRWNVARTERNLSLIADFIENCNRHAWHIEPSVNKHVHGIASVRQNPYSVLPHIELDNDCVVLRNASPWLEVALAAHNYDLTGDIPNVVFRASLFGLSIGPKLTTYVQRQYSDIADALLSSQTEINAKSRALESCVTVDNLEKFMTTIAADVWIFVSLSTNSSVMQDMIGHAATINTNGEKVFYTGRYRGAASEDFFKDALSGDLSNTIIICDSVTLMSSFTRDMNAPLRQFYLFGESKSEAMQNRSQG